MYHPTGKRPGRPRSLPANLDELFLNDLLGRIDPATQLVAPDLHGIACRLGVSHASIRRVARALHDNGTIESVVISLSPASSRTCTRYRIIHSFMKFDTMETSERNNGNDS